MQAHRIRHQYRPGCRGVALLRGVALVPAIDARSPAQSAEVCSFFETLCGPVTRLHLTKLDNQGAQVAFVEFGSSASAERALSCGGARIRVRFGSALRSGQAS